MAAPITKLSDRFADYTLRIRCKKCQHERTTDPHALANAYGMGDAPDKNCGEDALLEVQRPGRV